MSRPGRPTQPESWTDTEDATSLATTENLTADVSELRRQLEAETTIDNTSDGAEGHRSDDDFDDGFDESQPLPEHACTYCTYHKDTTAMLKCNICKKWFCNGKGLLTASHIILHLLSSKHKEITPHEDNPLGDDVMECYVCGSKNIFLLGFVPSKQDHVAVLICREPCLHSNTLKEMEWDPTAWLPLVEGRQLLSWVANAPKRKDMNNCRQITYKQVVQLEDLWKDNPNACFADLEHLHALGHDGPTLQPIPQRFRDGGNYREIFGPLVDAERAASLQQTETFELTNVSVGWKTNINRKYEGSFTATLDESRIAVGSLILIVHALSRFESEAVVLRVEPNTSSGNVFHCELSGNPRPPPIEVSTNYTIRLVFNDVPYQRMMKALSSFAEDESALSAHLYHSLLGLVANPVLLTAEPPIDLSAPNLANLNASQERAVSAVLQRPLSLIQGPPGTGKTTTTATIVYHLSRMYDSQILVSASSNVAVDELADRISRTGLTVVRVLAKSREDVPTTVGHLCLHTLVADLARRSTKYQTLGKLIMLKTETGNLRSEDQSKYKSLMESAEFDILSNADVICCSCSAAADRRLSSFRYQHVVVDESTQAHEPETLIPIVLGAKQVILVGDHCQLGPVVLSREASNAGLSRSLFERLVSIGHKPHRLEIQYRMHPFLSQFSSNCFYEGTLQNGVTAEERQSGNMFPWPNIRKPLLFYNSMAAEEMGFSGTSVLNRNEAALAEKMLTLLIKNGASPDECGVITPYEAQRVFLMNYLARAGSLGADVYRRVEVASVDAFQGREKDFIILSCVRSNNSHSIGFLKDWRRLNVALTRARRGVMVIGNAKVLAFHPLWHNFLQHCISNSLVVEGPVADLKPLMITLPKPRLTATAMGLATLNGPGEAAFGGLGAQQRQAPNNGIQGNLPPMYAISAATEDTMSTDGPYFEDEYTPGNLANTTYRQGGMTTGSEYGGTAPSQKSLYD